MKDRGHVLCITHLYVWWEPSLMKPGTALAAPLLLNAVCQAWWVYVSLMPSSRLYKGCLIFPDHSCERLNANQTIRIIKWDIWDGHWLRAPKMSHKYRWFLMLLSCNLVSFGAPLPTRQVSFYQTDHKGWLTWWPKRLRPPRWRMCWISPWLARERWCSLT